MRSIKRNLPPAGRHARPRPRPVNSNKEPAMITNRLHASLVAASAATFVALSFASTSARQPSAIAVDADDLSGIVRSTKGPEAGVWVIAETTDLPTKYVKIVVTD